MSECILSVRLCVGLFVWVCVCVLLRVQFYLRECSCVGGCAGVRAFLGCLCV